MKERLIWIVFGILGTWFAATSISVKAEGFSKSIDGWELKSNQSGVAATLTSNNEQAKMGFGCSKPDFHLDVLFILGGHVKTHGITDYGLKTAWVIFVIDGVSSDEMELGIVNEYEGYLITTTPKIRKYLFNKAISSQLLSIGTTDIRNNVFGANFTLKGSSKALNELRTICAKMRK